MFLKSFVQGEPLPTEIYRNLNILGYMHESFVHAENEFEF